jgi:hypothetical protein
MGNEELVEKAALAIWKASALDIMGTRDLEAEWRSFEDFDKEPYVRKARAVVNMVLEEAAKMAEEGTPLPTWVDEDPNCQLAQAAYDHEFCIARAIRALKSEPPK